MKYLKAIVTAVLVLGLIMAAWSAFVGDLTTKTGTATPDTGFFNQTSEVQNQTRALRQSVESVKGEEAGVLDRAQSYIGGSFQTIFLLLNLSSIVDALITDIATEAHIPLAEHITEIIVAIISFLLLIEVIQYIRGISG